MVRILVALAGFFGLLLLPSAATAASAATAPITWTPCPKSSGYLCGSLEVPLDYQHPARGSVRLAVIEHPVAHSSGVVVVNPGGPGESGVLILPILTSLMPAAVTQHETIVSFDERGTGASDPLLCGPSPADAGSAVAGTAAAARTFAGLERSCRAENPSLFPTVTTMTSVRDMDRLRVALGVPNIDYYGVSYGTVLGSEYAQMFPTHVRSFVLDGAVDANLSLITAASEEAPAIQTAIEHELTVCGSMGTCPLGSDPVAAYKALATRLARAPLPAPGDGDATPVGKGDLDTATLLYLSAPDFTPSYLPALKAAVAGNGAPLRSVAMGLETDLNGQSLVGPLWSITCNDAADHPDAKTTATLARSLESRYPLGGEEAVANNLIACPGWSGAGGTLAHLRPGHGPTALVLGNVYDPNTPYAVARQLAAAIDGRLVTYVGYGHSWLLNGSKNVCMQNVVGNYLLHGVLPAHGTRCSATS